MPTTLPSNLIADAYFMRRLHEVRQLRASLPASVQFDIARLPLKDQDLQTIREAFQPPEEPREFGFAGVLDQLLTAEPQRIPVGSLRELQQNLQSQGYLPESYTPSGIWDDESYVAFQRADRAAYDTMRSGKAPGSAPLDAGIRMITNTLPPLVWQGLVGTVKGMAAQTPETLSRVGLLGGALGGAAIGAQVGGMLGGVGAVPGALVGGAIGATTGFFADLFSTQEGEEDQSGMEKFIDALTPFEEYKQGGLRSFFEDLDYFLILGAGVGAAKLGSNYFRAGMQAYRGSVAGGMSKGAALWTKTPESIAGAAGAPTAIASALQSANWAKNIGWLQKTTKAITGMERGGEVVKGGMSLTGRPIFQMTNGLFTGTSAFQMAGRLVGGADLWTDVLGETKIEEAIRKAPIPSTGIGYEMKEGDPLWKAFLMPEDISFLTAFLLQPLRFFPYHVKALGQSATRFMSDQAVIWPLVHAAQHETPGLSAKQAYRQVQELFSSPDGTQNLTHLWADHAIDMEAARLLKAGENLHAKDMFRFKRIRSSLIRTVREEAQELGHSPSLTKMIGEAMQHPALFEAELVRMVGQGSGLSNLGRWRRAVDYIHDAERELQDSLVVEGRTARGALGGEEVTFTVPNVRGGVDEGLVQARKLEYRELDDKIKKLERLHANTTDVTKRGEYFEQLRVMKAQQEAIRVELSTLQKGAKAEAIAPDQVRLSLQRLDEWTRKDYHRKAAYLKSLKRIYDKARKAKTKTLATVEGEHESLVEGQALSVMNAELEQIAAAGYLSPDTFAKAAANPRAITKAIEELETQARGAARDIKLPQQYMDDLAGMGYKPVLMGEDVLFPFDMNTYVNLLDLPEWNRMAGFVETLGLSPRVNLEEDLFRLRHAHIVTALDDSLRRTQLKWGIKWPFANGNEVLYFLSRYMRDENLAGITHGPLVFSKKGGVNMYRVDARQLQPRHILEALEGKIAGINEEAALDIYGALRSGSSWSATDFQFMHPVQSARAMGRALRLNGLPGYSDLIRSWHTVEEFQTDPQKVMRGKARYRETADIAHSIESRRVKEQLARIAERLGIIPSHRQVLQMNFDLLYHSLHKLDPKGIPSPDFFFRTLSAEYLDNLAEVAEAAGYFKREWSAPRMEALISLAQRHLDAGVQWYRGSALAIHGAFLGAPKVVLRNGVELEAREVFTRLLAIISGNEWPKANTTKAFNVLKSYLEDPTRRTFPAMNRHMINKVFDENWVPDSPKFGEFCKALRLDDEALDAIVVDRRMAQMFGVGFISPADRTFIETQIKTLAKRLGIRNAEAQASLWLGYKEHFENLARYYKTRNPELAAKFRKLSDDVTSDPTGDFGYDFYLGQAALEETSLENFVASRPSNLTLTPYTVEEATARGAKAYLTANGRAGYMIAEDGEILNLFGHGGMGKRALHEAIYRGGRKVTFYDTEGLADFYRANGFVETVRQPFDPAMAPRGTRVEYQLLDPGDFVGEALGGATGPTATRVIKVGDEFALQEVRAPSRILDDTFPTREAAEARAAELQATPRKAPEYAEPARKLPKTRGYIYHGTSASRADQIAREGLIPGSRSRRMDALSDETKYTFFGDEPVEAISAPSNVGHWAQKGTKDRVLLRVKKSKVKGLRQDIEDEWLASQRVAPEDLEFLGPDNQWHPMTNRLEPAIEGSPDYVEAVYGKRNPIAFGRNRAQHQELLDFMEEQYGLMPGGQMMKIVEGRVLGQIDFGTDMGTIIRAFQGGDMYTLVHEGAHLFRLSLPQKTLLETEAMLGLRPASDLIDDLGPKAPLREITDAHLEEMYQSALTNGGFTFDPHTGQLIFPKAYAVGMHPGTWRTRGFKGQIATQVKRQMREDIAELLEEYSEQYGHSNVMIGGWVDKKGQLHLDPSEMVEDFARAKTKGALREQQSIYDFHGQVGAKGDEIFIRRDEYLAASRGWTAEVEERFADFLTDAILRPIAEGKYSGLSGMLRRHLGYLWHKTRPWAVEGGYVPNDLKRFYDSIFMDSLKDMGYAPKKTDLISKQVAMGAGVGAIEGAIYGDDSSDIMAGAAWGAAGGFVAKKALRHTYGYLPDMLARVNMALRYTFSATFDAGRYSEQNLLAATKYGIRPTFAPKKALRSRSWKSPFTDAEVTGEDAIRHGMRLWDELYGSGMGRFVDDTDRRAYQLGLLGFSPRHFEAYQAMELYQRGWSMARIKEAVAEIGRYGLGRSGLEKSINYVFFPFSFSKKLLLALGDWTLQQPGRNLLIHEGLRRYHESSLDEGFHNLIEDRLPILKQLWSVNNLAFGISPGRFFLEGITDNRTRVGQTAMALGQVFIPSGAATPLAKAMGGIGDYTVNLFTPLVLTGESVSRAGGIDSLDDIVRRYIPLVREVDTYFRGAKEQWTVISDPAHMSAWSQFQEFQEESRAIKDSYEPIAWAMGYQGTDGLFGSELGPVFQQKYNDEMAELGRRFPTGLKMSTEYTNTAAIDKQALADLAVRPDKSAAEEAILDIAERIYTLEQVADTGILDAAMVKMLLTSQVRQIAERWASDRRFGELWDRFYLRDYGPIRRIA